MTRLQAYCKRTKIFQEILQARWAWSAILDSPEGDGVGARQYGSSTDGRRRNAGQRLLEVSGSTFILTRTGEMPWTKVKKL
jgi:hypothetical protein